MSYQPGCSRCGGQIPINAKFCPACGHNIQPLNKSKGGWLTVIAALLFFGATVGAFNYLSSPPSTPSQPTTSNKTTPSFVTSSPLPPASTVESPTTNKTTRPSTPVSEEREASNDALIEDEDDEETVYITRTGRKYHRAGCRYLSRSMIPISLEDAQAEYEPCSVCEPPE